jgi:hypothetical protein
VTLSGRVRVTKASKKRKRSCRANQKVALLRRDPNSGGWPTIDVAVTRKNGTFSLKVRPVLAMTWTYRARVKETRRCTGAISKKVKIKATT